MKLTTYLIFNSAGNSRLVTKTQDMFIIAHYETKRLQVSQCQVDFVGSFLLSVEKLCKQKTTIKNSYLIKRFLLGNDLGLDGSRFFTHLLFES